jgi:hypothetical protein
LLVNIDKLTQREQQLTSLVELLKNEELEILRRRRRKLQEQSIEESQPQPQLGYQQPVHQEIPNRSEEEQRILAIPLTCINWERNWKELLKCGLQDYRTTG